MDIIKLLQEQAQKASAIADITEDPEIYKEAIDIANSLDYIAAMVDIGSISIDVNMNVYYQKKYGVNNPSVS